MLDRFKIAIQILGLAAAYSIAAAIGSLSLWGTGVTETRGVGEVFLTCWKRSLKSERTITEN